MAFLTQSEIETHAVTLKDLVVRLKRGMPDEQFACMGTAASLAEQLGHPGLAATILERSGEARDQVEAAAQATAHDLATLTVELVKRSTRPLQGDPS